MATVSKDIVIDAPVDVVYAQWTQFEDFPQFMKNVTQVRQIDDSRLLWTAEIAGREHTWEAKIAEQKQNRRIAWRATEGLQNGGTVTFEPADEGSKSRVRVEMEYEPKGIAEKIGSAGERRLRGGARGPRASPAHVSGRGGSRAAASSSATTQRRFR